MGVLCTSSLAANPQVLEAARSAFEAGAQMLRQTHLRGRRDLSLLLAQSAVQVTPELRGYRDRPCMYSPTGL